MHKRDPGMGIELLGPREPAADEGTPEFSPDYWKAAMPTPAGVEPPGNQYRPIHDYTAESWE